jgi:hypothetical protein
MEREVRLLAHVAENVAGVADAEAQDTPGIDNDQELGDGKSQTDENGQTEDSEGEEIDQIKITLGKRCFHEFLLVNVQDERFRGCPIVTQLDLDVKF